MKKDKIWKKLLLIVIGALILLIIICLLWGPLFPWGPKFGYVHKEYDKAVVCSKTSSGLGDTPNLDVIMKDEENFHRMQYDQKVKIIIITSEGEWRRLVPYLSYGVGGVSLMRGNIIFINKSKIDSHNYQYDAFFKHELSHNILYQNSSLINSYRMFKQSMPIELIATYYGGPRDYYKDETEFLEAWKKADLKLSDDSFLLFDGLEKQGGKLSYTTYRYFMEFMAEKKGTENVQQFITNYAKDPKSFEDDFSSAFGITFKEAKKEFSDSLSKRTTVLDY